MNALVVYDSTFGNTQRVAQAIAGSLAAPALRVGELNAARLVGLRLLVVGSPTQRFRATPALSGWLHGLPASALRGVQVAAFDTRLLVPEARSALLGLLAWLVGPEAYAATHVADGLRKRGGQLIALPEGFLMQDTEGPLGEGELERAARWGEGLRAESSAPGICPVGAW